MGIDIDSFLEEFDSSDDVKVEVQEDSKKSKEIDLTFDKYVNDKFNKLQENVNEEDFNFLVRAYSEIKKFDNRLPSKLLELNKASSSVLNVLGKKYTTTFLEGIKVNKNKHGTFIIENLNLISDLILKKQIPKAIDLYNKITASYQLFPKEFIIEKIELGKKLRSIEIQINEEFTIFWAKELKQIKTKLSEEISSLKQNLVPGRIELIELNLHNINLILDNAPSIFYNELVNERIQVSRIIIISEEFLKKQYIIEFEEKNQQFQYLFERFHRYQIRKDVNSALTCYDEILYLFEKMPDAFIEKKIAIYEKINKSFESLNNLLLTNSISQFMDTYSSSKILSQAREYISHAKLNLDFDSTNLISIKHELNAIPDQLTPEKNELENEILEILDKKTVYKAKKYLEKSFKDKNLNLEQLKYYQDKLSRIPENDDPDREIMLNKISDIISRVENRYSTQEKEVRSSNINTDIEKYNSRKNQNFDGLKPNNYNNNNENVTQEKKVKIESSDINREKLEIVNKKAICEAKKYLEKSFKNKNLNLEQLKYHKNKLSQIPENDDPDRKIILNKISDIISRVENRHITQEKEVRSSNINTDIEKYNSRKIQNFDELKPKNYNNDEKVTQKKKIKVESSDINREKLEIVNKKAIREAKKYLEKSFKDKNLNLEQLKYHQDKLSQISKNDDTVKKIILSKISDIISRVEDRNITQEKKVPNFDELRPDNHNNKNGTQKKEIKIESSNREKTESKKISNSDEVKPENHNNKSISQEKNIINNNNNKIKNTITSSNNTQNQAGIPKPIIKSKNISEPLIDVKHLGQTKLNNVNITMIDEINKNFEIIQRSQDLGEKERLTKKINFYISLLPLNEIQKEQILQRLNKG
jgi:hypothetical protein